MKRAGRFEVLVRALPALFENHLADRLDQFLRSSDRTIGVLENCGLHPPDPARKVVRVRQEGIPVQGHASIELTSRNEMCPWSSTRKPWSVSSRTSRSASLVQRESAE